MVGSLSQREELILLLNEATELEHSLSCGYLFTSFSLKSSAEEGLPPETVEAVLRWKHAFSGIAVEEMFHLAVVNALLVSLGGAPNFDRPNFPHDCAYYMPEYQIELRAFSEDLVRQVIAIEQPDGSNLPALLEPERLTHVQGDLDNEIGADPMNLDSQKDVYYLVNDGLINMAARMGEKNVFIGPLPEAIKQFLESNGWQSVVSLESIFHNLAKIVEQGEGAAVDNPNSHHARFTAVLNEYERFRSEYPGFDPARPMLANPFTRTPPEASGPVNLIDDEEAIRVSDLFNEAYTAMLQLLGRAFVATDETPEEGTRLIDAAIEVMAGVLLPLGELLARLPAGPSHPGLTAGPSFVVRTMHTLPHKASAWYLLHERFEELAAYTQQLPAVDLAPAALQDVGATLTRIAEMLTLSNGSNPA